MRGLCNAIYGGFLSAVSENLTAYEMLSMKANGIYLMIIMVIRLMVMMLVMVVLLLVLLLLLLRLLVLLLLIL